MAQTVVIDIEARYRDQTAAGVKGTADDVERLRRKLADTETEGKKASAALEKIASTAKTIAKKTITIPVKILDYATRPLRGLINYATSLKGILTGLFMGQVGQNMFIKPTQYAETLKSQTLAFENMLGSAEAAQKMIADIKKFDEESAAFDFMPIVEQTRMLMTYKLANKDNAVDMVKTIGDAAMGLGGGTPAIERIVRALGQMKAKGKVSAEEMNQLQEVGMGGWNYLSDYFGISTAQVQALTQKNKIPVEQAIEALLAGMKKDYGGMADLNANKTFAGLWSQVTAKLKNGVYLRWGEGLDEGAMQAAGKMAEWFDEAEGSIKGLGDAAHQLGRDISTYAAEKFIAFGESVKSVLSSEEFRNADTLSEKMKIAWDKVIAEPFDEWWNGKGQAWMAGTAEKIGGGLGKFYKGTILTVLGITPDGAVDGGLSIGAKFAEGFLEGFDAEKVWSAVKEAFGKMLGSAAKIIPGGEKADGASWLSAALLGMGAGKLIGVGRPLVGGLGGLGSAAAGSGAAVALGKLFTGGGAALGGGLLGKLGVGAAAGPMTAGALSALGIAGGAGIAGGGLGLLSGFADLRRSSNTMNKKEQRDMSWSGMSKVGMVGLGAAIGTAIMPGIGSAIGAGIGGLGALFAGGKVGKSISDYFDGTGKLQKTVDELYDTNQEFLNLQAKATGVETLMRQYEDLQEKVKGGKLTAEEMTTAQGDMKTIVEQLAQVYPNLITQYDIENGKLEYKLGLLKDVTDAERDRARKDAELAVVQGENELPALKTAMSRSKGDYKEYDERASTLMGEAARAQSLSGEYAVAGKDRKAAIIQEFRDMEEELGINLMPNFLGKDAQDEIDAVYGKIMTQAQAAMEARKTEMDTLDDLQAKYEAIYGAKMDLAINPEDVDLGSIEQKLEEISALQDNINSLTSTLSGMDKGSKEYEETAQKIEDAKGKQENLKTEVEKFHDPLQKVLDTVRDINTQFSDLGNKRLDFDQMGLNSLGDYFFKNVVTGKPESGKIGNTTYSAYASGTLSAKAGLAWVGEEGPELMRLRGGERIYNADESRRIAAQNERSTRQTAPVAASPPPVSLGGINVQVNAAETGGDAVAALRANLPELSNELLKLISVQLAKEYSNMPMRVEGIAT